MKKVKASHKHYIELKLHDVSQLFNSMDPSPFIEKDLDQSAEEFIVSWAHEFPINEPLRLRLYLGVQLSDLEKEQIQVAIHNYFDYKSKLSRMELGRLFDQGRMSLLIGLIFLAVCLVITRVFLMQYTQAAWGSFLRESLTIAGWVAMWKPMQIYLYDWWPIRRKVNIYNKLSIMPVELILKN